MPESGEHGASNQADDKNRSNADKYDIKFHKTKNPSRPRQHWTCGDHSTNAKREVSAKILSTLGSSSSSILYVLQFHVHFLHVTRSIHSSLQTFVHFIALSVFQQSGHEHEKQGTYNNDNGQKNADKHDLKIHKAENPWRPRRNRPRTFRDLDEVEAKTQVDRNAAYILTAGCLFSKIHFPTVQHVLLLAIYSHS